MIQGHTMTHPNPFTELFGTQEAVDYLNDHGKPIAKITLKKKKHLGRLLHPRCRIYFKRELDAFINDQDYARDTDYEDTLLDQLLDTQTAADYLDINPTWLNKLAKAEKIQSHRLSGSLYFIQVWLDEYRNDIPFNRTHKEQS